MSRRSSTTTSNAFRSIASSAARARSAGRSNSAAVLKTLLRPLDPHLHRDGDVRVQPDGHLVLAHRLDGLLEVDPAAVELEGEALLLEPVGDVAVGHGAEELPFLARAGLEHDGRALELARTAAGLEEVTARALLVELLLFLDAPDVARARRVRETLRDQVVASVARLHVDDLAGLAE